MKDCARSKNRDLLHGTVGQRDGVVTKNRICGQDGRMVKVHTLSNRVLVGDSFIRLSLIFKKLCESI